MASHAEVAPKPVNTEFIGRSFVRIRPGRALALVQLASRIASCSLLAALFSSDEPLGAQRGQGHSLGRPVWRVAVVWLVPICVRLMCLLHTTFLAWSFLDCSGRLLGNFGGVEG